MKRLRTKIIITLLILVFIPLIPTSILVFQVVHQIYRIGVNPQIQGSLQQGINFSKMVYDLQRKDLLKTLDFMMHERDFYSLTDITRLAKLIPERVDTSYWRLHSLSLMNEQGEKISEYDYDTGAEKGIDPRILGEFQLTKRSGLVVSDRKANHFITILKCEEISAPPTFVVLQTSIQKGPLVASDSLIHIHQIYQTLDFKREQLSKSFWLSFIVIFILQLGLVILLGIWLSARLTSPLSQLVIATEAIGKGNLDYQLPASSRQDEIGRLINHFNDMTHRLKENQERLIYLEKIAAWQQMSRKIAHEIKNPLTPIQLTVQQLVDKYDGSNKEYQRLLQECFEIIQDEIGSLRRLVTEFSEFGRLPELQRIRGDLHNLIREVSSLYAGRIQLQLDEQVPCFAFDEDRLRRILINLIQNAIQADPMNQPITIETEYREKVVLLRVKDRGEGIAPEHLTKIFEPYFSTKKSSTGLGLAICRLMIEEQGGTIKVESEVHKGSTFIIELPLDQTEGANHER